MFKLIENIPQIPEELLLYNVEDITNRENTFLKEFANNDQEATQMVYHDGKQQEIKVSDWYSTHDVSDEIYDFLRPHFDNDIQIRYQVIKKQLPIHIDVGSRSGLHVFNYVLLPGGDNVKTRWWKMPEEKQLVLYGEGTVDIAFGEEQNKEQLLQESIFLPEQWHKLRVDIPHDISKLDSPRVGITLWQV